MAQANVYTSLANAAIYTDKVRISTGTSAVTYQVYEIYPTDIGNRYTAEVTVPANSSADVLVGVQNRLTVTGTGYTALEIGTQSSGIRSVGR